MINKTTTKRPPVRLLVFSGSLRSGSLNTRLAQLAAGTIAAHAAEVDAASLRDFDVPPYNNDVERRDGIPPGAHALHQRLTDADGLVLASPEYNASMPGIVKNLIDWVSRFRPQPFREKQVLLMSASPSMSGGNRGLWALRVPLEHLGARVYPDMFSLARAHQAFDDNGQLADPKRQEYFTSTVVAFINLVEAVKHYPCAKARWIEFRGELFDPATERVEG